MYYPGTEELIIKKKRRGGLKITREMMEHFLLKKEADLEITDIVYDKTREIFLVLVRGEDAPEITEGDEVVHLRPDKFLREIN